MLLRFQKAADARKLRDRKSSLFNAFEIFDYTGSNARPYRDPGLSAGAIATLTSESAQP